MANNKTVSVGVVGTSWWADAMYLPAMQDHAYGKVTAICGRNPERARHMAERWHIPKVYTDYNEMIKSGDIQAIIVSTNNDSHYPITMAALEAGLHVLCEKPLAMTYPQTREMADLAAQKGVKNVVPFTYRFMPAARYLKELVEGGYIGKPYHLNLRYYTGYGRSDKYDARFDMDVSGAGSIADIGSHFLYIGEWFYGPITAVNCQLGILMQRDPLNPQGKPYRQSDQTAIVMLTFANGAQGVVMVSTLCYEGTPFGQTHHWEFHGSEGTLYMLNDWNTVQRVTGTRDGEGPAKEMPIPDRVWGVARRDTVHNTYRDVFRKQDYMTRQFVTAIAEDRPVSPTFEDGARVQRLIEACVKSNQECGQVEVASIN
jgi:predicted dehydrogenase